MPGNDQGQEGETPMTDSSQKLVRAATAALMLAVVVWWYFESAEPDLPTTYHQVDLSVAGMH